MQTEKTEPSAGSAPEAKAPEPPPLPPKTYRVIVESMYRDAAAASRRAGLRDRKCVVAPSESAPFYLNWSGGQAILEEARIYSVAEAFSFPSYYSLGLLDEELIKQEPPRPKFDISLWLNHHFMALLQKAPGNVMVHGMVASRFGAHPPSTITTFPELKNWIECNGYVPKVKPTTTTSAMGGEAPAHGIADLDIPVVQTRIHSGICNYRQQKQFSGMMQITRGRIAELLRSGRSSSGIMDHIANDLNDPNRIITDEVPGEEMDIETSSHQQSVVEVHSTKFDEAALLDQLEAYIILHFPQAAAERGLT